MLSAAQASRTGLRPSDGIIRTVPVNPEGGLKTVAQTMRTLTLTCGLAAALLAIPTAQAFNFGDMFNPGRWMGGNRDRGDYYDDYGGPWGPGYGGVPYGYGAPGYGVPGYGAPGYGVPGYGYGAPGYAAPGYGVPVAPPVAPPAAAPAVDARDQELETLRRRIEQLESRGSGAGSQRPPAAGNAPPGAGDGGWPSAPAFRPMDQY